MALGASGDGGAVPLPRGVRGEGGRASKLELRLVIDGVGTEPCANPGTMAIGDARRPAAAGQYSVARRGGDIATVGQRAANGLVPPGCARP